MPCSQSGLPLIQALDILAKQTENKAFGNIIGEIKAEVEGGSTFADALKKYPKIFSDLYANMVAAGEVGDADLQHAGGRGRPGVGPPGGRWRGTPVDLARDAAAARLDPDTLANARERLNLYRTLYGSADSE